jgi:hypothetical protein
MRQGDRRGIDIDLSDFTYDGDVVDGYLSGGLGQLTDTEEGLANFRLHQSPDGGAVVAGTVRRRGYEWVGWRCRRTAIVVTRDYFHIRNDVRRIVVNSAAR